MKGLSTLILCLAVLSISAQTSLYTEDFDTSPISMTASSANSSPTWGLNTTFQTSGMNSDSAKVQLNDTLFLESNAFSTMGFSFVTLNFSQICKVDFFDEGIVEYSTDNGVSWIRLTSSEYNGSGFISNNSFSSVSYSAWDVANSGTIPTQSWWRNESFDLSATANQTQVKVRFLLVDTDNNGSRGNYGWLIDDIEVLGAPCELIPPSITLTGTVYQGTVYGTGPYLIEADIQDASGIASATLEYTINSGSSNTLTMNLSTGTTYEATIPSANIGDTICYIIRATDNTTCSNQAQLPSNSCTQFIVNQSAPPNCIGNPISNFNYAETFATFIPGDGRNPGGLGALNNDWSNSTADTHDWWVYNQSTRSGSTGPTADHSPGDANYLYVEATGFNNTTAIINTPCYNLSGLRAPKFSFWYYMYGASLGELHVDIYNGNTWTLDVTPAVIGDQGAQWLFREIDLSAYAGNIIQLRFRGIVGAGFQSDIAIDDIEIIEPIANELSLIDFVTPNASSCNGSANEIVTVNIENLGSADQDTIPLVYRVNGGALVRDTAFFNLGAAASFNHTFQQTFDMSTPGSYNIDAWVELSNDGNTSNDTILGYNVTTNSITSNFPDTTDFENFTVGTPGVFAGGWSNDPNNTFDWFVNSGGTNSGQTGPNGDTTTTSGLGKYIYYEATNVPQGTQGSFFSTCLNISNTNKPELKFFYHMSGLDMGSLHLDLSLNGFLIQNIIPVISGDQGNQWKERVVDLTPYKGDVRIIFRATRGNGFRSDIAIDQVSLRDAQPLSLDGIEEGGTLSLYPNPLEGQLTVNVESQSELIVYNSIGSLIYQAQLNQGSTKINTSRWSRGVYFVSLIDKEGNVNSGKVIKK